MSKAFIYDGPGTVDATTNDGTRGVPDDVTFGAVSPGFKATRNAAKCGL